MISVNLAGGDTGFARIFLRLFQLLLRTGQGLLLSVNLSLCFAVVFGEPCLVAQLHAGIGIISSGTEPGFAFSYIQFALELRDFLFLIGNLFLPFFRVSFTLCVGLFVLVCILCIIFAGGSRRGALSAAGLGIACGYCGLRRLADHRRNHVIVDDLRRRIRFLLGTGGTLG